MNCIRLQCQTLPHPISSERQVCECYNVPSNVLIRSCRPVITIMESRVWHLRHESFKLPALFQTCLTKVPSLLLCNTCTSDSFVISRHAMMLSRAHPPPNLLLLRPHASLPVPARLPIHTSIVRPRRPFTSSTTRYQQQQHRKESFSSRLREALARTRIQWYSIPAVAGIGFLGLLQFTKVQRRERARLEEEGLYGGDGSGGEPPKKRKRTTPEGPWYAQAMVVMLLPG